MLKNHPKAEELNYRREEITQIINQLLSLEVYDSSHVNYRLAEKIYVNLS